MNRLYAFGPEIWTAEGPVVSFYGFRYPTRMAVVRLSNGELLVWSPIKLDDQIRSEIAALGPVAHLVSPNKLHHLYLAQWKSAYPTARLHLPPGLAKKKPELHFDSELGNEPDIAWRGELDQVRFDGSVYLTEIVFFHRASGTALFGDLIENFPPSWFSGWRGFLARLGGIVTPDYGAPGDFRLSFLRRDKARKALARILDWHPQRVVIAHGDGAGAAGEAFIRHAFRWLI
jgi:hypothetical protein